MALRDRILEVIYRLRDQFTGPVGKITAGYKQLGSQAEATTTRLNGLNSKLKSGFDGLLGSVRGLVAGFTGLAAAAKFGSFLEAADRAAKLAKSLQINVESLNELKFAAELNGVSFEQLAAAIQKQTKAAGEALFGNKQLLDTFSSLGITVDQLRTLSPDQLFEEIAAGFNQIGSRAEQAAAANRIFGRSWREFVVLLDQGREGIQAYRAEARELGGITNETAAAVERFNDQLTVLRRQTAGPAANFGGRIAEGFSLILREFGIGTDVIDQNLIRLREVRTELARLEQERARIQQRSDGQLFPYDQALAENIDKRIETLTARLRELLFRVQDLADAPGGNAAVDEQAAAIDELIETRETLIKSFDLSADAAAKALQKETAEYRKAKDAQIAIEKEFQALREEVTAPEIAEGEVRGLDVAIKANEARQALVRGDAEAAVRIARQGGDLLRQLAEQGEESAGFLAFLADQLKRVATEAAGKDVKAELIDKEQAEQTLADISAKIAALGNIKITADPVSLEQLTAQIQSAVQAGVNGVEIAPPGFYDAIPARGTR